MFVSHRSNRMTYWLLSHYKVVPYDIINILWNFEPNRIEGYFSILHVCDAKWYFWSFPWFHVMLLSFQWSMRRQSDILEPRLMLKIWWKLETTTEIGSSSERKLLLESFWRKPFESSMLSKKIGTRRRYLNLTFAFCEWYYRYYLWFSFPARSDACHWDVPRLPSKAWLSWKR